MGGLVHGDARRPRLVGAALGVGMLGCLLFAVHVGLGMFGPRTSPLWNHWVYDGVICWAALCCVGRAASVRAERGAWLGIGLGLLCWVLGDLYWNTVLDALDHPPYPSWADLGWLMFFPPTYAGAVLLVRSRVERVGASAWLDGVIGALAMASLAAAFAFDPLVASTKGTVSTVVTNLAYPAGDVVLLGVVVAGSALQGWRSGRGWALLGLGLAVAAAADTGYLIGVAHDTYVEGHLLDAGWPLAATLLALAAWQPTPVRQVVRGGWGPQLLACVFALTAVGVLLFDTVHRVNVVAHLLVTAAVVASMLRLGLAARERSQLERTRVEARTDELTGLGNRREFYARADLATVSGTPTGFLLDLDRFKDFNDTLGHHAGDELLCQVAERLRGTMREDALIARLGGDEFVTLLEDVSGVDGALECTRAVRAALEEPFALEGLLVHAQASIGVAISPDHGTTRTELLHHADVAMYRAKTRASGVEVYAAQSDGHSRERLELASELRHALDAGELILHYQPKEELSSGTVTSVEALVRWQHPRHGLLYPDGFVPVAEQHALMRPFTLLVLGQALDQQRTWREAGLSLSVAVNLSPANLLDTRFPDDVAELLDRAGTLPGALQLEITENTIMLDPERSLDVLARLSELGVDLSLDDFGTGYSSLAYLKRLPVRELKIDKSFVLELNSDADDAAIVRSTIDLARNLGLRVVAEGVETAAHRERLVDYGCDTGQGFLLSRPLPADQLEGWLRCREQEPVARVGASGSGGEQLVEPAGALGLGQLAKAAERLAVDDDLGEGHEAGPAGELGATVRVP